MKNYNYIFALLLILITFSCGNGDDSLDETRVQILLDQGETPLDIYSKGIPIDSLYGKFYKEGIIFHFDSDNGTGLVLSLKDLDNKVNCWYDKGHSLQKLKITVYTKLISNLGAEWYLPSRGEFRLISINLYKKGIGGLLPNKMYWTSTEYDKDNAWRLNFGYGGSTTFKDQKNYVRAIKAF